MRPSPTALRGSGPVDPDIDSRQMLKSRGNGRRACAPIQTTEATAQRRGGVLPSGRAGGKVAICSSSVHPNGGLRFRAFKAYSGR